MGVHEALEMLLDLAPLEQDGADLGHPVVDGAQARGLDIKGDELGHEGQTAVPLYRLFDVHVIHIVAFHAVDDLHAIVLARVPHIREGLDHAVICHGHGGHPPVRRPLHQGLGVGKGVGIGKSRM